MKKTSILELNINEFHSETDPRILEINDSNDTFEEKVKKIRDIRSDIAKEMKFAEHSRYREYLESTQWNRKRRLVLKRANYKCEGCGNADVKLDVHHLTYERKGMELLTDLVAYCKVCHELAHGNVYHKDFIHWWSYLNLSTNKKPSGLSIKEIEQLSEEELRSELLKDV